MSLLPLTDLLDRLRAADETTEIEAKKGSSVGPSVLRTVSALANEPGLGGGYILLGVAEEPDGLFGVTYSVVGVKEPGKIQSDLATQCRNDLQPPVRPEIRPEEHDGKTVVVAFIPESPTGDKPVFLRVEGLPAGAYRRVGGSDQHCTDDDLALLFQGRTGAPYDSTAVDGTTFDDVDAGAVREYRLRRAEVNKDASELRYSDEELLHALNATVIHRGTQQLTVAGLMLFGKEAALRRHAPMTRVDYVLVEGRDWIRDPGNRFSATELRGPLLSLIPRVVQQVLADVPAAFSLAPDDLQRRDVPLIPRQVIREAVVNALMHRNYRVSSPTQILRYVNRIEIRNVGYSLKPEERLGEPGSLPRNPSIAAALHEAGLAETKGAGIRTMRELMHKANLTPPFFESDRQKDEFGLMLLVHHLLSEKDLAWLERFAEVGLSDDEARVLVVVRETGAITNAMYRDITGVDTLGASRSLLRLRDAGLLKQRGKGRATFYTPTEPLLEDGDHLAFDEVVRKPEEPRGQPEGLAGQPEELAAQPEGLSGQPERLGKIPLELHQVPPELAGAVRALGGRPDSETLRAAIEQLCAWRPLRAIDLARILDRNLNYLREQHLSPMVLDRRLEYTIPATPTHPQQAYRAKKRLPGVAQ